jgi:hypothetical protein
MSGKNNFSGHDVLFIAVGHLHQPDSPIISSRLTGGKIMLMKRIIGAFTFRKEVYAEVEKDVEFTPTAWLLVVVISFLNQIGQLPGYSGRFGQWLLSAVITVVLSVAGFALGAFLISWLGKTLFKADVDFGEMVRVLGLAYVWNIVGLIGILGFIPFLVCILAPLVFVAALAGLVSWVFAAKEALDLDWGPTIITVLVAWVVNFAVIAVGGLILGALGLGAAGITSALQGG